MCALPPKFTPTPLLLRMLPRFSPTSLSRRFSPRLGLPRVPPTITTPRCRTVGDSYPISEMSMYVWAPVSACAVGR